ncbi:MAG: hypothetical protein ABR614_07825 [Mycobacteriales bacterium]
MADLVLPGRIAELLADHGEVGLTEALDVLVVELGLRSAVVRGSDGLRAVAGEATHAVPAMRVVPASPRGTVELPLRASGRDAGTLTVVGARPSQLAALRATAAVIGLALSRPVAGGQSDVLDAAEGDADDTADRLHDGVVQALVVARYAADAAVRGGSACAARDAVQSALVELRRTVWHLRPRGSAGLLPALGQLSQRLQEVGAPPLGLLLDEPVAGALSAPAAALAYRLVQAVAVPDGAGAVRVSVRREGRSAVLDLDGGAPLTTPARWATKARALEGTLTVSDGRVRLSVPLDRTKANP